MTPPQHAHECPIPECIERLTRIEERMDALMRSVQGNGQPGLAQRVSALELWRSGIAAVLAFLLAAGGVLGAVLGHK